MGKYPIASSPYLELCDHRNYFMIDRLKSMGPAEVELTIRFATDCTTGHGNRVIKTDWMQISDKCLGENCMQRLSADVRLH